MRKLKIRHQPLPGIGEWLELDRVARDSLTVVTLRSGRRQIAIATTDEAQPAGLTRAEALAVARLHTGTHIVLATAPAS